MKTNKMQLKEIPFQEKFYSLYELKEDTHIILNGLSVYAVEGEEDFYADKVDFDIFIDGEGNQCISPRYNPLHCDYFLLAGFRLAMCQTIEINADDVVDYYYDNYFGRIG